MEESYRLDQMGRNACVGRHNALQSAQCSVRLGGRANTHRLSWPSLDPMLAV